MGLLIFFGIIIVFMIADTAQVKREIDEATKIKWTKNDAVEYYKIFTKSDIKFKHKLTQK